MIHENQTRSSDYIEQEERYGAHIYAPLDIVVERAQGVWLYDVEGTRYLDCVSAYSAVNQGHCHPRIRAALVEQSGRVTLTSRAMRNDRLPEFLKKLTALCGYDMALPTNTGVEAVETAIKLARRWGYEVKGIAPDRAEIVVFANNFHGRTLAAVSASSSQQYRRSFGPFAPGFVLAPYGDFATLEATVNERTCAILIEPIQGEAGVIVPPPGYLAQAAQLARERNVLLVADEIQTGLGRTGNLFACDAETVKPDILLVGKALGGGYYPVSAALASAELMSLFGRGDHGSTFGGNPLAAAVAIASIDVIVDERLAERARSRGRRLTDGLRRIGSRRIREIRGRGLLIGIDIDGDARELADALLQRGVAAKDTHKNVLRLAPPLIIEESEIDFLLSAFEGTLAGKR